MMNLLKVLFFLWIGVGAAWSASGNTQEPYCSELLTKTPATPQETTLIEEFLANLNKMADPLEDSEVFSLIAFSIDSIQNQDPVFFTEENKRSIEDKIQSIVEAKGTKLLYENFLRTKLFQVYSLMPGTGRLFEIFNMARNHKGLTDEQEAIETFFSKAKYQKIKRHIHSAKDVGDLEVINGGINLYSGFTLSDSVAIHQAGFRDGNGYGPPGSHQIGQGIYATSKENSALKWGRVKAQNRNDEMAAKLPEELAALNSVGLLKMKVDPESKILDVVNSKPNQIRELLGFVGMLSHGGAYKMFVKEGERSLRDYNSSFKREFRKYVRLRESLPNVPESVWETPIEAFCVLFDIDIYRTTIYLDVGISGGTEYVVRDRNIILNSTMIEEGQETPVQISTHSEAIKAAIDDTFLPQFKLYLSEKKFHEAAEFANAYSNIFRGVSEIYFLNALKSVSDEDILELYYYIMTNNPNDGIFPVIRQIHTFLLDERLIAPSLINDPLYKERLEWFLELRNRPSTRSEDYYEGLVNWTNARRLRDIYLEN